MFADMNQAWKILNIPGESIYVHLRIQEDSRFLSHYFLLEILGPCPKFDLWHPSQKMMIMKLAFLKAHKFPGQKKGGERFTYIALSRLFFSTPLPFGEMILSQVPPMYKKKTKTRYQVCLPLSLGFASLISVPQEWPTIPFFPGLWNSFTQIRPLVTPKSAAQSSHRLEASAGSLKVILSELLISKVHL